MLINEIDNLGKGTVKTRVNHLGIWLTSAEEDMEKVNFDYLIGRMEKATNRIIRRNQCCFILTVLPNNRVLDQ